MVRKITKKFIEKFTAFSLVMTTIMVTGMLSFNLILHGQMDWYTFIVSWPVMFVAAFTLQSFVAMPIAQRVTHLMKKVS